MPHEKSKQVKIKYPMKIWHVCVWKLNTAALFEYNFLREILHIASFFFCEYRNKWSFLGNKKVFICLFLHMVAHWCEWLIIYRRNSFSLLWILLVSFLLHSAVKAQKPCTFNFSCYFLFHINSLTHIHKGLDPANTFAHWVDWGPNKFTWRWSRLWKQRAHGEAMTVLSKVERRGSCRCRWVWLVDEYGRVLSSPAFNQTTNPRCCKHSTVLHEFIQ